MSDHTRTFLGASAAFLGFVGLSAVAGLLVTVAVTPAVAITGMAASNTITTFENLPNYLKINELAEGSTIYATAADGSAVKLATFYDQNREEVPLEAISPFAVDAAIAGEDPRFYEHRGVDLQSTARATLKTLLKQGTQGGSTLTQQYVKNVLVQDAVMTAKTKEEQEKAVDAAIETTPDRKLKEMRFAIGLEKQYSKADILKGYLNIAHFGGTVYGIEAASKYYFGNVSAKDLTLEQAASLIAIVNNPEKFRLDRPDSEANGAAAGYKKNHDRRNYILKQMYKHKKITIEQYDAARQLPVVPAIHPPSIGCSSAAGAGYFCDYVYEVIRNDSTFGATAEERIERLRRGGLDIYTTLNLGLQAASEAALNENVSSTDPRFDVGATAVTVEPGTGRILAMTQNKVFSNDPEVLQANGPGWSSVNYNTDIDYGGSSGFQPGSTYKVFTLAEWLNQGHSLREHFDGRKRPFTKFTDSCEGNWNVNPGYNPRNDDGRIAFNAIDATMWSVNSSFMAMAQQLDLCKIKLTAEAFGIHRADGGTLMMYPADVLGSQEVAPITMAAAFAGIANKGATCEPVAIDRIVDRTGADVPVPPSKCKQSVEPSVAAGMAYAMQRTFYSGGTAGASHTGTDVPHIGKTGTTDDAGDTWMIGASTRAATAVWVGNVTGEANLRDLEFASGDAATARHRIWARIMRTADDTWGGDAFPEPDAKALRVSLADVPDVRGKSLEDARRILEEAGFTAVDGGQQDSELPAGQVTGTDLSGTAPRGSTIQVYTSNGLVALMPNVIGMKTNQAQAALAGFSVRVDDVGTTDPNQDGKVTASNPAAGTPVKAGSEVIIAVGKLKKANG
ncbi:MAG TPA: transglycosylase domain-containing protein [Glaciibacter sp.]|nr:transglycosylase domain-containing protein [Glaciibacter sp.]